MPGHGAKALPLPHMAPDHSALLVPNRYYIHASQILLILSQDFLCLLLGSVQRFLGRHIANHGCLDIVI